MEIEDQQQFNETEQPGKTSSFFSRHALALVIAGASVLFVFGIVAGSIINLASTVIATKYLVKSGLIAGAASPDSTPAASEVPVPVTINLKADAPILGDPNAKVTVVEFADFQCPFCHEFFTAVFPKFKTDYIDTGKVKFVYQDFPFLGDESVAAAEAAKCAQDQNKFWEYHDYLFNHQNGENEGAFTAVKLKQFAKNLSLDTAKFSGCLDSHEKQAAVTDEVDAGTSYGVKATPTLFINGYKYEGVGSIELLRQAVEQALKS